MKIYGDILTSNVDGPDKRVILHTAGCTVGCKGCFSPHTHANSGPNVKELSISQITDQCLDRAIDCTTRSITISGGEPTDQFQELIDLLRELRLYNFDSIIVYSGRTLEYLTKHYPQYCDILMHERLIDVLIDGPFVTLLPESAFVRGSTNQKFNFLTPRHTLSDMNHHGVEFHINDDASVTVLGFPTKDVLNYFV